MTMFEATREFASSLDRQDPLAAFRSEFRLPDDRDGVRNIYVCGNSLGLQPRAATQYVDAVMDDWGRLAVEGHFKGERPWIRYQHLATRGFATLTGAQEPEVIAMNTLTVNLHLLMASFYTPERKRRKILIESTAFPSDYYAVVSQIRFHGLDPTDCLIEWRPREDELLHIEDLELILEKHGQDIALMLLPGVQYYSGQVIDMAKVCALAKVSGCKIGLDLAHAIGNVAISLHDWAPDFAAWCTYKYLNSGPGAVGGAFVHTRHLQADGPRLLAGWWGNAESTRFDMSRTFDPADGVGRWQLSNPPILAIAPLLASLAIFERAGMTALRKKSTLQLAYLEFLLEHFLADRIGVITPGNARGCQLSLVIREPALDARGVFKRLSAAHVTGDWREPNVIRVAPVPLYNSFEDIYELAARLDEAVTVNDR